MLICMPIKTLLLYLAATHSLGTKVIFHYSLDKAKPTIYLVWIVHLFFKTVKTEVEYTNVGGYLIFKLRSFRGAQTIPI